MNPNDGLTVQELAPERALRPYLRRWVFFDYDSQERVVNQVAPSGTMFLNHAYESDQIELLFGNESHFFHDKTRFVGHPIRKDIKIVYEGVHRQVLAEFTHTGFYELFKIPVFELNNTQPSIDLYGHKKLSAELHDLVDSGEIKGKINSYLQQLVQSKAEIPTAFKKCVNEINTNQSRSLLDISKTLSGYSQKNIYRMFRMYTGLSPKQFIRVHQLNRIIQLINSANFESLTAVALEAGYYDQADFIRHFKEYLEESPSQLINRETEVLFDFMGGIKKN